MPRSWFNSHRFLRLTALMSIAWLAAAFCGTDPSALAGGPYKNPARPGAQPADQFAVPDGGPEKLIDFINKMRRFQPAKNVQAAEKQMQLTKANNAMLAAADKLLGGEASAAQRVTAFTVKLQAILFLRQANSGFGQSSDKQMEDLAKQLKDEKDPELAKLYKQASFAMTLSALARGDKDSPQAWNDIKAELTANPPDHKTLVQVEAAARQAEHFERADTDLALLQQVHFDLLEIILKQNDPNNVFLAKKVAAVAKRLSLVGKPIEIKGRTFDGKQFDLATYAGKVTLVLFWGNSISTSSGELSTAKQAYDKYHSKGFDVVGINLDEEKEAVKQAITRQKIPWPNLFMESKESRGFKHPLAIQYGVDGAPVGILVNRHGVVASVLARGPELDKMLEELMGKVEPDELANQERDGAKVAEGEKRRATLVGHPVEFQGSLLGGKPFDPATLKGKVVLIDFWASWCGPCRAEMPNVKKTYQQFHDKGFEVVGVSIDRNVDDLKKYLAEEKIRWQILFSNTKKEQYWNHPMAVYYGINAIPSTILVDQNGNAVAIDVRGEDLPKKVAELLKTGALAGNVANASKGLSAASGAGGGTGAGSGTSISNGAHGAAGPSLVSKEGRFSVEFPGTTQVLEQQVDTPTGGAAAHTLISTANRSVYQITYYDLPGVEDAKTVDAEKTLDAARDALAKTGQSRVTAETKITLSGKWPGREIVLAPTGPLGRQYTWHIYSVDKRVYEIGFGGLLSHGPADEVTRRFFDSFKVTGDADGGVNDWKPFNSKEGRFTSIFPTAPEAVTTELPVPGGKLTLHQLRSKKDNELVDVIYLDMPSAIEPKDLKAFNKGFVEGVSSAIAKANGELATLRLVKETEVTHQSKWPGMEFVLETTNDSKFVVNCRSVHVNSRVYAIIRGTIGSKPSDESVQKFFDSFKVTSE